MHVDLKDVTHEPLLTASCKTCKVTRISREEIVCISFGQGTIVFMLREARSSSQCFVTLFTLPSRIHRSSKRTMYLFDPLSFLLLWRCLHIPSLHANVFSRLHPQCFSLSPKRTAFSIKPQELDTIFRKSQDCFTNKYQWTVHSPTQKPKRLC